MNTALNKVLVNSKLPACSFRIGQIAGGPPRGAWSTTDWLPIIVKSSVSLGVFPKAQGVGVIQRGVFISNTDGLAPVMDPYSRRIKRYS